MLNTRNDYLIHRDSYLKDFLTWGAAFFGSTVATGSLVTGAVGGAAIVGLNNGAGLAMARVDMDVMAVLWNSYLCGDRYVQATGQIMVGGEPNTNMGIVTIQCRWETTWVEIGGQSYPVDLKLCHYLTQ